MAPANDMQRNGVAMRELSMKLLQKVEELTLHVIAQDKCINELEGKQVGVRLRYRIAS